MATATRPGAHPGSQEPAPAPPAIATATVSIEADGGARLVGTLRRPPGAPTMAIVLHGATGVPARFYGDFAAWLAAEHGAAVLTYDYRDFGASATGHPRSSRACMSDWGIADQGAALNEMLQRFPDIPLRVIGHSMGAHWLAFHGSIDRVDRVVAVASGPAFWLDHPWPFMPAVVWFWWLGGPLAVRLAGYMPGRITGLGPDLPAGVYRQWRRWCLTRDFARGDWGTSLPAPRLDQARFALATIGMSDDVMIPPSSVARLAEFYPFARVRHETIVPAELGLARIGHTGMFSRHCQSAWPRLVRPLLDALAEAKPATPA